MSTFYFLERKKHDIKSFSLYRKINAAAWLQQYGTFYWHPKTFHAGSNFRRAPRGMELAVQRIGHVFPSHG
jgi:hypothetical protein